jgi:hypothetical protein
MNTELHTLLREMLICSEIILEFEALDTPHAEAAQQIHHWASFLSNLSEKINQMSGKRRSLAPYYRTMDAPLRRIIGYTDILLANATEPLTLNQEYSFQRIRRMASQAALLAQEKLTELSKAKSSDAPSTSNR